MFSLTILTPFFFAGAVGFSHAFEADHLIAVSSIVSKRKQVMHAIRDGIFWGLGHTSTILLIGIIMIIGQVQIPKVGFQWLEALVGIMLVGLGIFRLVKGLKQDRTPHSHPHKPGLAYGVGAIHGLAGSGALILLVMTELQGSMSMIGYLVTFGVGSIAGMMLAAGLFSLPTTQLMLNKKYIRNTAVILSSTLCIGYGCWLAGSSLGVW
ncbi:MAG: urease accessory protein [Bacteroidota bacterium]